LLDNAGALIPAKKVPKEDCSTGINLWEIHLITFEESIGLIAFQEKQN